MGDNGRGLDCNSLVAIRSFANFSLRFAYRNPWKGGWRSHWLRGKRPEVYRFSAQTQDQSCGTWRCLRPVAVGIKKPAQVSSPLSWAASLAMSISKKQALKKFPWPKRDHVVESVSRFFAVIVRPKLSVPTYVKHTSGWSGPPSGQKSVWNFFAWVPSPGAGNSKVYQNDISKKFPHGTFWCRGVGVPSPGFLFSSCDCSSGWWRRPMGTALIGGGRLWGQVCFALVGVRGHSTPMAPPPLWWSTPWMARRSQCRLGGGMWACLYASGDKSWAS